MAVLVAIAIPVFTSRLEQSRETTDIANLRSAYAAGQVAALQGIDGAKITTATVYRYDPNASEGLSTTGGISGQGTATDGKTKIEGLPKMISYSTGLDVRDSVIACEFNSSGLVSVSFSKN